jgi:hypothetical protein
MRHVMLKQSLRLLSGPILDVVKAIVAKYKPTDNQSCVNGEIAKDSLRIGTIQFDILIVFDLLTQQLQ